jgi:hypothetical protein
MPCDRTSADSADQPSPAEDASSADVGGNLLVPNICESMALPAGHRR